MLKISKQSDYGLIFLGQLVRADEYLSLSEIIKKTGLPERFLARIASQLKKAGLVESQEGFKGGYKIKKNFYKITLFDYLKIFEKNLFFTSCNQKFRCKYQDICQHKDFFKKKLLGIFLEKLKNHKLKDFIKRR